MICAKCGREVAADAPYCPYCAEKDGREDIPCDGKTAQSPAASPQQFRYGRESSSNGSRIHIRYFHFPAHKWRNGLILAGGILFLLAFLFFAVPVLLFITLFGAVLWFLVR